MNLVLHPGFRLQKLTIGREQAPLVVIDNLVADPDGLVDLAATKLFGDVVTYYPGVRAKVPLTYQQFILAQLRDVFAGCFGLGANAVRLTACHFSLVTTPPHKLDYLQRIPHFDSTFGTELAFIHYLFKTDLGGTAFYRHRATGYEYIDAARAPVYGRLVEEEEAGPDSADAAYINGDTPLYERVGHQDGVFNRLLIYRRTSLHSAALARNFIPDLNPRTGRLSINGFLA
ncbi:MAG TPA: DUF6445 family protein [Terriglobia bacterium]|nr:DUF6445 family protein [Terriglobia bacterium]HEU5133551.1 DUF6445 family protein [Steroidobacteraceae bacterium]